MEGMESDKCVAAAWFDVYVASGTVCETRQTWRGLV